MHVKDLVVKQISRENMDMILNAGIIAPSSCGIEQFRFVAVGLAGKKLAVDLGTV